MPRYIIKLKDDKTSKDYYMEWSTVVDAPVTYGLPLEAFREYYQHEYGNSGMRGLDEILKSVEEHGISSYSYYNTLEAKLEYNRAGKGETTLDKEGLLENYCRNWE